jgi:nucleotide-binding universal stress UspA family protein
MVSLTTILVPTDFSPPSEAALAYARALAESFGATIHVLHVIENPFLSMGPTELFVPAPQSFAEELDGEALRRLDALFPGDDRARFGARTVLRHGRPYVEIDDYAREHQIDLIVMGTHGRTALAHLLLGSVTEKVIRTAPCPVLTVRERVRTGGRAEDAQTEVQA